MKTPPVRRWMFASDSSDKQHETLQYADGSLSCSCPGWTRRCVGGVRTCKHVRSVQTGCAGQGQSLTNPKPIAVPGPVQAQATGRRFDLET